MLATTGIFGWIIRGILAVIVFLLVEWLLPPLLAYLKVVPPQPLVYLIALVCALLVLFYPYVKARV